MHGEYENLIREDLKTEPMVALTLGGWTGPFQSSYLAAICHWINDN